MKIDKQLNLVLPVYTEEKVTAYVHSAPIGRPVFERHFRLISRAFNEIFSQGHGIMGGPRIAALLIKTIATEQGNWEGTDGVERTLIEEIRRLTNVVSPDTTGRWETLPLMEALNSGVISEDDFHEIENALSFFTVGSHMLHKTEIRGVMASALGIWSAQLTSLNTTEFMNSLQTSTPPAPTGPKETPGPVTQFSIPS